MTSGVVVNAQGHRCQWQQEEWPALRSGGSSTVFLAVYPPLVPQALSEFDL